jgi:hypothetical protein
VTTQQVITVAQGAQMIASHQGRSYSYQALKYLIEKGRLPRSSIRDDKGKAKGVYRDLLIEEFESTIGTRETIDTRRRERRESPSACEPPIIPDYAESRALREYELALMAQMDRRKREGELLERSQVDRVWAQSVTIAKTALLGVPSRVKERIPHLTLDEIGTITELIRSALEEVANADAE